MARLLVGELLLTPISYKTQLIKKNWLVKGKGRDIYTKGKKLFASR